MINPYAFIIMMRHFALMFESYDHHDKAHHANAYCVLLKNNLNLKKFNTT